MEMEIKVKKWKKKEKIFGYKNGKYCKKMEKIGTCET